MYNRFKNIRQFFVNPHAEPKPDIVIDLGEANVGVHMPVAKTNFDNASVAAIKLFSSHLDYSSGNFRPEESTYPPRTVLCRIQ